MKFDNVLKTIGEFGLYQKRIYFLISLLSIHCAFFMTMSVFMLGVPDHRCAIPGYENDTYAVQSDFHRVLINKTIPPDVDGELSYDQCDIYDVTISNDVINIPTNATRKKCDRWVYDETVFKSTFTSEENLICDKEMLPSIADMLFFAGVFVGAIGFGILSDVIGRKKSLMASVVLLLACSVALVWANSFLTFAILRFILGTANAGIIMTSFVIGMEFVGPTKRIWAGVVGEYFFSVGLVILVGLAYFLRDWKYIEMVAAFSCVLYLSFFWLIPESPRWLLAHNRFEEAEAVMRKAAEVNGAALPENIFDENSIDPSEPNGSMLQLFSTKVMAGRTIILFFNWMVVSMVYFGLSLNSDNLAGDLYLNFFISGLVEFPAYTLCILLLDRLGRKWLHCISMVLGGVACVSTVFTTIYGGGKLDTVTVVLAMLGKLGAASAYAVMYVFSAELFPTVVRNAGLGACSACARIGAIAAPYIADMNKVVPGDLGHALPLVIFGGFSIAAGLLALFLPETLNKDLPETIEDAQQFGQTSRHIADREIQANDNFPLELNVSAHIQDLQKEV